MVILVRLVPGTQVENHCFLLCKYSLITSLETSEKVKSLTMFFLLQRMDSEGKASILLFKLKITFKMFRRVTLFKESNYNNKFY